MQFKIIFVDNGSTIYRIQGNNPVKVTISMLKFIKNKYGGR